MDVEPFFIIFGGIIFIMIICNCCCKQNNNQIHSVNNQMDIRIDILENNQHNVLEENIELNNEENNILENTLSISIESYNNEFKKKLKKLKKVKLKDHPNYFDESIECPISFDTLNFEEEIYLIPCKHIFKKKDLEDMLRLKNECPICRNKIFI